MPIRESAALGYLAPETLRGHGTGAEFRSQILRWLLHGVLFSNPAPSLATRTAAENVATSRCEKRGAHS
jgi:hypothetical protein